MERFENRVGRGTQGFPKLGKVVFVFFPLPKFGKCCRYRFYGFPRLGSVAGGVLQVFRFWEGLPTPSGRFPKVGNTCGPCLSYFPTLGRIFFSYSIFSQSGQLFSAFYLQFIALVEPHFGCCIAGHSPIATRTKANATHFRAIGQARTLELLGEETAEEHP